MGCVVGTSICCIDSFTFFLRSFTIFEGYPVEHAFPADDLNLPFQKGSQRHCFQNCFFVGKIPNCTNWAEAETDNVSDHKHGQQYTLIKLRSYSFDSMLLCHYFAKVPWKTQIWQNPKKYIFDSICIQCIRQVRKSPPSSKRVLIRSWWSDAWVAHCREWWTEGEPQFKALRCKCSNIIYIKLSYLQVYFQYNYPKSLW